MAIIGIDLGTSNSAAAVLRGHQLLRLRVVVPERLSSAERRLYEQRRELHR